MAEHMGAPENNLKRKKEMSVLDNFTKLTNSQEKIRIEGGVQLLNHLSQIENNDHELKYTLGRLIRGLSSSKTQAKAGFFATFVGVLNLKNLTCDEVFETIEKELHIGGCYSKSENADISAGQILAAGAILHSNFYGTLQISEKIRVVELLLKGGKERQYLNLASMKFLSDFYETINGDEFECIFPAIKPELVKSWQEHNLDSLYLLLETQRCHPLKPKFLKNILGSTEIISEGALPQLCEILTTIPRIDALKHPIYEIIIKMIATSNWVVEFFANLDETLQRPNRNKYLVFAKILTGVLPKLSNYGVIPEMLTTNFIQQTITTYKTAMGKSRDLEFQKATKNLFEVLLECQKKPQVSDKIRIKTLRRLLFYPGTFIFEKLTKSKLIQGISGTLHVEGVKKLGEIYWGVILAIEERVIGENLSERWWNIDRIYASHLLVKLLNHPAMVMENQWKIAQLSKLAHLGLIDDDNANIGSELADALKNTFYSGLDLKLSKLEDLHMILTAVVKNLDDTIKQSQLRLDLGVENWGMWQKTVKLCRGKLSKKNEKKSIVFHTLFLHLALQLFNNAKLAADSLNELFCCYDRVNVKNGQHSDKDPLWIEVVVDLFLNLLSHNSHLLRSVINHVFPHLCEFLNATALHQILAVLDPQNEENPLSRGVEEEEDTDTDSSSSDEEDDDDDDEEEEEEEETVNDKLRLALHQALGDATSDAESIDLDNLDEDEGAKLDVALGAAFKQFKPNLGRQKKQTKDDETLTHFRIRVLDLIEIYLNCHPSMILTLEIMLPLLQILEFSIRDDHQRPLQNRVRACLKKLTSLKKFDDVNDVSETILADLLQSLLEKGTKNAIIIQEMAEKIAEASIFIINCSQNVDNIGNGKIAQILGENLGNFFQNRDSFVPFVLYKNVLQLNWPGIIHLIPILLPFIFTPNLRAFRRNQAVELAKIFFKNHRFAQSYPEEIQQIEECLSDFLMDCLGFFRELTAEVREKFLCNLFELLIEIRGSDLGGKCTCWGALGVQLRDCRTTVTLSKRCRKVFNKLCTNLGIPSDVVMSDKPMKLTGNIEKHDEEENAAKPAKKKRKIHLNSEQLKLKKQTKELRLQSLSDGLSSKRHLVWNGVTSMTEE